jgi:hypothetical protein
MLGYVGYETDVEGRESESHTPTTSARKCLWLRVLRKHLLARSLMGFRGSPVQIRPSRLEVSKGPVASYAAGLLLFADSASSESER